jgi:hypothetical protein
LKSALRSCSADILASFAWFMDMDGAVDLTDHHGLVASRFLRRLQLVDYFIDGMSIGRGMSESSQVRTAQSERASAFLRDNRYDMASIKLQPVWHRSPSSVKNTPAFLPMCTDHPFHASHCEGSNGRTS